MNEDETYQNASRQNEEDSSSGNKHETYERHAYSRNSNQESSHNYLIEVPDYVESWDLESRLKSRKH